jgi:hypothetical protein
MWEMKKYYLESRSRGPPSTTGYWKKDKRRDRRTWRRGRRRRKILDDLKERRGYSHLKEEALDRTMWRARFGRGFGPVVRQTTKWMNNTMTWLLHDKLEIPFRVHRGKLSCNEVWPRHFYPRFSLHVSSQISLRVTTFPQPSKVNDWTESSGTFEKTEWH